MTVKAFESLKENLRIGENEIPKEWVTFLETHISYLMLLKHEVYKLKKTVKLPFVDFLDLSARKEACDQELKLNRRLAPAVYLDVLPVKEHHGTIGIGTSAGKTVDYAVKMKRINNELEMDRLLERKIVTHSQVEALAKVISSFHEHAVTVQKIWEADRLKSTYNQLRDWHLFAKNKLGQVYADIIDQSCRKSDTFIDQHIGIINNRSQMGYVRDLHGDLHSQNIFLTNPPVVFDCIEFDEDLRQIDILNEIAFFLMDLEYYKAYTLVSHFMKCYQHHLQDTDLGQFMDEELLLYFKMYRASVRAKVLMISAKEASQMKNKYLGEVRQYLDLVKKYHKQLT